MRVGDVVTVRRDQVPFYLAGQKAVLIMETSIDFLADFNGWGNSEVHKDGRWYINKDNMDISLGDVSAKDVEAGPLSNQNTALAWWNRLKTKNGFQVLSKVDKKVLEEIVLAKVFSMPTK